jgi:hypothetical protein
MHFYGMTDDSIFSLSPGIYSVTVTDADSASNVLSVQLPADSINVSLTPPGPITSCYMAYAVTLTATSLPNVAYYFRVNPMDSNTTWVQYNDGNTFQPNAVGQNEYWVEAVDTVTGCADTSAIVKVYLNDLPDPQFSVGDCFNHTIILATLQTNPSYSYQWILNYDNIPGATNALFTATQTGWYRLRVTDSCGVTTASDSVYIDATCFTGLKEIGASEIKIYPNPNDGKFIVEGYDANGLVEVQVLNVLGQIIYNASLNATTTNAKQEIDLSYLSNGVYTLRMRSKNSEATCNLVISH